MVKPLHEQKLTHKVETRPAQSLAEELTQLRDAIMQRAYEIFCDRPAGLAGPLDDWLAAERELIWQPLMTVAENDDGFVLEVAVPGLKASEIEVQSTEDEILIKSEACATPPAGEILHVCELPRGKVFRTVQLPRKINRDKVSAELHEGLLKITVPAAPVPQARKVPVAA